MKAAKRSSMYLPMAALILTVAPAIAWAQTDEIQVYDAAIAEPGAFRDYGEPILLDQRENLNQIGLKIRTHRVAHQF